MKGGEMKGGEVAGGSEDARRPGVRTFESAEHHACVDQIGKWAEIQSLRGGIDGGHGDKHQSVGIRYITLGRMRRSAGECAFNASFAVVGLVPTFQYSLVVDLEVRRVDDGCNQEQCNYRTVIEQSREHILTPCERATGTVNIVPAFLDLHCLSATSDTIVVSAQIIDLFPGLREDEMVLGSRVWRFIHPQLEVNVDSARLVVTEDV